MPMSQGFALRQARDADRTQVQALLQRSDLPLDGLDEQFGENYAVAIADDAVVGVEGIELYGADGLLRSAAVDSAHRGRGIGEALTHNRLEWARSRRLQAIYLLTTTASEYFPRFGFVRVPRDAAPDGIRASREFSEACPASATFMKLQLSASDSP